MASTFTNPSLHSQAASPAWWGSDVAALTQWLGSDALSGLSINEAKRRLRSDGPNRMPAADSPRWQQLLAHQFASPLVVILLIGAVLSTLLHEWPNSAIIVAIICISAGLGFAQEMRASAAVSKLKRRLALKARVVRNGVERSVPATAVVPGDAVLLSAGNLVPADGRVLEARDFLVVEASLTGESLPVEKCAGLLPADTPLSQRFNCVFLGTSVRSGSARVLVTATGATTAFGAVAARLSQRAPETEFARGLRRFGEMLLRVMLVMVLVVLVGNQWLGRPLVESLLFAAALAVGLSPELLPTIVSVTLARGARLMATRGVLVRRLDAIENLGGIDVLCTDKTGTLTVGEVTLQSALDVHGNPSDDVRHLAYINAAFETGIANPLDAAIVAAARAGRFSSAGVSKVDEIPYDFQRRRLTVVVDDGAGDDSHLIVTKGALDNILAVCSTHRGGAPLDAAIRQRVDSQFRAHGAAGLRVLGIASKRVPARSRYGVRDECDMRFEGLLLFADPPKADAARSLAGLAALGVQVKIVSGDNRHVTAHLAEALALPERSLLTGAEIAAMSDEALWQRAPLTGLFVEVDPAQKERIVLALQRTGHAVGYLGDGINDAPALRAADVGISVHDAVDVARDSADIVLLRPDLGLLQCGVVDGRRAFANTLKYIRITTSANFGNMVSMAVGALWLPFLPLAAKQILLNNFLSDLPSLALADDRVDATQLSAPQRWHLGDLRRFMLVFGLTSTAFDLLTFRVLIDAFGANEATFQTAWFVVSLLTELAVLLVLRTQRPMWASAPSLLLLVSTLAVSMLAATLPYLAITQAMFGFVELSATMVIALLAIVVGYVSCVEAFKRVVERKRSR